MNKNQSKKGFTIVEIMAVILLIAILTLIVIVGYRNVTKNAIVSTMQIDLSRAAEQIKIFQSKSPTNDFPTAINCVNTTATELCLKPTGSSVYNSYSYDNSVYPKTFLLQETNGALVYQVTNDSSPVAVGSPYIQTITAANCPVTRTQVQDARDSHTYWVQKLADNKCWMLTNLGYTGGGTNTYSDTKTLTNGTGGATTYTVASYYVTPSTTNFTTEPDAPSTSTNGTGQYGYLYNFCAANGGQVGNGACDGASSTAVNTTISICPAGWRLPTGNGGEFTALNTAINGGLTNTDAGLIGNPWLAQRGGRWNSGFTNQGSFGYYWSYTQSAATSASGLYFQSTFLTPTNNDYKYNGFAVRCVAI